MHMGKGKRPEPAGFVPKQDGTDCRRPTGCPFRALRLNFAGMGDRNHSWPRLARCAALLSAAAGLTAAAPPVTFAPAGQRFASAAEEYRQLWEAEGQRIAAVMEAVTGLTFPDDPIEAIVSETPPMTAYDGRSMRLKGSYSADYRLATLIHEMGHRLALTLPRRGGLDDHRLLYLFLYDVWTDLYGRDYADHMVRIERRIPGGYDYDAAWAWALAMTREERQARLRALLPRLGYAPFEVAVEPSAAERSSSVIGMR